MVESREDFDARSALAFQFSRAHCEEVGVKAHIPHMPSVIGGVASWAARPALDVLRFDGGAVTPRHAAPPWYLSAIIAASAPYANVEKAYLFSEFNT